MQFFSGLTPSLRKRNAPQFSSKENEKQNNETTPEEFHCHSVYTGQERIEGLNAILPRINKDLV
jgi:hypothetical protein